MVKKLTIITILIVTMASLYACSEAESSEKIEVTFTSDGFKQIGTMVTIDGYHKGARAEIEYLIHNQTGQEITPELSEVYHMDPESCSYIEGRGYVQVPSYYSDWIDVPKPGKISDGDSASYIIVLVIPEDAEEEIPEKWAFVTLAASRTGGTGGFTEVTPGVWCLVNMR